MLTIKILPFHFSDESLKILASKIESIIGWPAIIHKIDFNYSYAHNPDRGQYYSSQLLIGIKNLINSEQDKIIAVTDLDLFIPILTFVFGEAQLDGQAAVVSTFRLRPEYYGLPQNDDLVLQRLVKESIHELGHTFGLVHCENPGCVLNASTYVEEIDLKEAYFCPLCQKQIDKSKMYFNKN